MKKKEPSLEELVKILIANDENQRKAHRARANAIFQAERITQIKSFRKNIRGVKIWKE